MMSGPLAGVGPMSGRIPAVTLTLPSVLLQRNPRGEGAWP